MAKGPIVRRAVTGCLERIFDELQLLLLEQGLVARRGIDQQDLLLACRLGAELVDDGVVIEGQIGLGVVVLGQALEGGG